MAHLTTQNKILTICNFLTAHWLVNEKEFKAEWNTEKQKNCS